MSDALDEAQTFFATHGWCVLRGVIPEAELAPVRAASEALMPDVAVPRADVGVPLVLRPSLRDSTLARWLAAPLPFALAARVLGAPGVQLLQDALLVKLPHAQHSLAWHQDASYFSYLDPLDVVSVRLALGEESVATGCLHVIDGSHLQHRPTGPAFATARVEDVSLQGLGEPVPIELQPGDVSLHHCRTLHASFNNRGAVARRTLVAHVASSHCRVVPGRLPAEIAQWFPTDAAGALAGHTFWHLPGGPSDQADW